jgi:hypothetical protein
MRLEGLGKLKKNSMNSSGCEPATFRLVAQRLNHLRYCVITIIIIMIIIIIIIILLKN